jgi:hypothetical protein
MDFCGGVRSIALDYKECVCYMRKCGNGEETEGGVIDEHYVLY